MHSSYILSVRSQTSVATILLKRSATLRLVTYIHPYTRYRRRLAGMTVVAFVRLSSN